MNAITIVQAGNWQDASDAKAMLVDLASNPPRYMQAALPDILTGRPVYQYDRDDIRVARLEAFASGWFAACGAFDMTVDEAIGRARAAYRLREAHEGRKQFWLRLGFTLGEATRRADMSEPLDLSAAEREAGDHLVEGLEA